MTLRLRSERVPGEGRNGEDVEEGHRDLDQVRECGESLVGKA